MSKPNYKTSRKYKCPYCNFKATRGELVEHVDKLHDDLIPNNYTAARAVYDSINGKNYGLCMICKEPVYEWNDKINRYRNLCDNPKCKARVREIALERHLRVYNKPTLLNEPEQQEKMLAGRRISGTYTFTDGAKMTYTGLYEKNALEFMDKVLNIPSKDIQAPGPVLEYEFEGQIHKWITDIYYIPANLLIEVKDGGSNPNTRSMPVYRSKQAAKEVMITKLGTFNYVRLTDNNFAQLLDILADIKNEAITSDNPNMKIHINEEVGGLPPHRPPVAYVVPYGMNGVFSGFAYTDSELDKYIIDDDDGMLPLVEDAFRTKYELGPLLVYEAADVEYKIREIHDLISNPPKTVKDIIGVLTGSKIIDNNQILCTECFRYYDVEEQKLKCKLIENATANMLDKDFDKNIIRTDGEHVIICHSEKGYYAITNGDFYMASEYFSDLESLEASGIIDIMNNIYSNNSKKEVSSDAI